MSRRNGVPASLTLATGIMSQPDISPVWAMEEFGELRNITGRTRGLNEGQLETTMLKASWWCGIIPTSLKVVNIVSSGLAGDSTCSTTVTDGSFSLCSEDPVIIEGLVAGCLAYKTTQNPEANAIATTFTNVTILMVFKTLLPKIFMR